MDPALRAPWLVAALCIGAPLASARQIEGVDFADRVQAGGVELRLHSVGLLRYLIVIKAYVAGLYLGPGAGADRVLADAPRRLEIHYFYAISAEDLSSSTAELMRRNLDAPQYEMLRPRIDRFNALYRAVRPDDRYALTYLPGVGTELALNGERLGVIEGTDFARALFSVWFGDRAIDASLKRALLDPS